VILGELNAPKKKRGREELIQALRSIVPRSFHYLARRAKLRRGGNSRAAPVGMTGSGPEEGGGIAWGLKRIAGVLRNRVEN
jgi:hypothetical protein